MSEKIPLVFAKTKTICPHCQGKSYVKLTSHSTGGKCHKCGVFDKPGNSSPFTFKDVPPTPNEQTNIPVERREHIYHTVDGEPLLKVKVLKFSNGDKSCPQFRWNGKEWKPGGLPSKDLTLYRAPALFALQAAPQEVKARHSVYVVEGEKDVETLEKLDLLATCNPMGAGKWSLQYNELLRGLNVVMLPDNDTPGREHGAKVFQALQGIAASVKIVNLWELMPNLMEKGDVSDFIAAGGKIADVVAKAESTPIEQHSPISAPVTEKAQTITNEPGQDVKDAPLIISNYTAVRDQVSTTEWAWMQWIPKGFLTMIAAQPGKGKSYFCLWLAKIFTHGGVLPNGTTYTPKQGGKILWCDTEGAQGMTLERAASIELPLEDIYAPLENPFDPVNLGNLEHRKRLEMLCDRNEIQIIVIDSLSGAHSKKENDSGEMKEILIWLQGVAQRTKKPIICTHHFNKLNFQDALPNIDKVRGSSAIIQFFRSIISIDCPDVLTPERKRLAVIKANLCMTPEMLGFEIADGGREIIFMDAPDAPKKETASGKAIVWLADFLKEEKAQTDVEDAAKNAGFSGATIRRAKKSLGVKSTHRYDHFTKEKSWYWSLEKQGAHQGAQKNAVQKIEHLEHLEHLATEKPETTHAQGDTFFERVGEVSPKYKDYLTMDAQNL